MMQGYVITFSENSDYYIPEALYIKRDKLCNAFMYENDAAAAQGAIMDGVKLIHGMEDVPDGVYIDTEENRKIIKRMLELYPKYRRPAKSLAPYIQEKLALFEDFEITLTEHELQELWQQTCEINVDNFIRRMYKKYL